MVGGNYVPKFSEASHVCFEGHLDDPSFRSIAIQKILKLEDNIVTLEKSGKLKIATASNGREIVKTAFVCPLFGRQKTTGHPFKDSNTEVPS